MITDWEPIGDIFTYFPTKEARANLHPKLRQKSVTIRFWHSEEAGMYSATIKKWEGRNSRIAQFPPKKSLADLISLVLCDVEVMYGK